ncbi:CBS domain-containing protein [Thalassolituus sp. LLYu03]|uniref:CBS domain-containing protein n=1 Tax=Thalassolituus sp. LLYu03 TaxID=3421656 RepID=UPI003D2D3F18
MSLIVFDMGRRIETPLRPELFRVKAMQATEALAPVQAGHNDAEGKNSSGQGYRQQEKAPESVAFVADIMTTQVRTLGDQASAADAWAVLSSERFHHLPITDSNGQILAMLSDRDLMRALIRNPAVLSQPALSLAKRPVLCVLKNTDIRQTSHILHAYGIGALPVVGDDHKTLAGIITRGDLLQLLSHYGPMELWA